MKSPILIAALALASLLAIPPLTSSAPPDQPDVQAECFRKAPAFAVDTFTAVAAPARCSDCLQITAPASFAAVPIPLQLEDGSPLLMIAAEQIWNQRHPFHDPGRQLQWRSDTMNGPANDCSSLLTDSLRNHQGAGAGGLSHC